MRAHRFGIVRAVGFVIEENPFAVFNKAAIDRALNENFLIAVSPRFRIRQRFARAHSHIERPFALHRFRIPQTHAQFAFQKARDRAGTNGFALGGGCEISMSCDIRICSENAVFGQPEVGLGITPGFGGTQRLARIVGTGKAKEMIYGARNIKAEEAYRIGLVNNVYPAEELMPAAKKLASTIARNAPIAVRNCKRAINEGIQVDMDQAIVIEEKLFGSCFETCDQKEGMNAFLEKRKVDAFLNK